MPKDEKIFVILATIGNLINDNNKTMLVQESIKTLKENRKLIILTMEDAYMRDGVVGGYVTSGERQGEEAAQLVLKYLKNKSLKEVSSIKEGSNIYIFNVQELSKARILLSQYVRRVSKIINPNESFMQKNELLILEILVVTLLIVIFSVTATYALQRKKFTEQVEELTRMQADKDELYSKEILLSHVLQEENMAYWKVNALTGELHLSSELIDKLRINMRVYKNDKDLLSYFIHFNDKKLFHDKLEEVKSSKESLLFFHRIINANNKILNIKHLLYFEQREQDAPASIIGIIKFDE